MARDAKALQSALEACQDQPETPAMERVARRLLTDAEVESVSGGEYHSQNGGFHAMGAWPGSGNYIQTGGSYNQGGNENYVMDLKREIDVQE